MTPRESPFQTGAADYDRWFDSDRGARIFQMEANCLREALGTQGGRWLEVGVGTGRFAQALALEAGIDPSPAMAALCAARGIPVLVASGEQLPFPPAAFDGIVLACTLCFLRDPRRVLQECRRVLTSGGRLVIGFIPANSPWGAYHSRRGKQGHAFYAAARFYLRDEVRALAEEVGFTSLTAHGCALPDPDTSADDSARNSPPLSEPSFVVLSFSK